MMSSHVDDYSDYGDYDDGAHGFCDSLGGEKHRTEND